MRVLSFIPALLLTAASFVAAAPSAIPLDDSCTTTGGSHDDTPLHPVISAVANATVHLQPYHDKLGGIDAASCQPQDIIDIMVDIHAVVELCIDQIKAAVQVDLSHIFLGNLCVAIYAHLTVILGVIQLLVKLCLSVHVDVLVAIKDTICAFLNITVDLLACFNVYVVVGITDVLGALCIAVKVTVDLCLGIFASVGVWAH